MQQRKLDIEPSCICPYKTNSNNAKNKNNFLLALQDGTLQVFSDFNLVWAAKVFISILSLLLFIIVFYIFI
jgi:hypothetical protein